jgi:phosphopantothenoylcysteine decarboxylase/phosphopantothenate--cysteine ligase
LLKGKKIVLGVTGSIAAYKAALLVRLLKKSGAEVRVIMTPGARDFITPLTLSTLSGNPVLSEFTEGNEGVWNNHVDLGLWADLLVIAPASANELAKMANGLCDNLLMAVYLSARCKVLFAPAMDLDMYKHPATQVNLKKLESFGNSMVEPNVGELASGLIGQGRMAEPEELVEAISKALGAGKKSIPTMNAGMTSSKKKAKKILITAGPTVEAIDPVRFISNHSSGKMGFAIAEEFANQGYSVDLVTGPVHIDTVNPAINRIDVVSAADMFKAATKLAAKADIIVMAAAVADYKPAQVADKKIKKKGNEMVIELAKTTDILATVGKSKKKGQFLAGFALETDNEVANAQKKLKEKNLDLIVLNSLQDKGAGFGHDTNKIKIITANNKTFNFELKTKKEAAADIVAHILTLAVK